MRGKEVEGKADTIEYRITPAYAGKSLSGAAMWNEFTDHPRLCGEKFLLSKGGLLCAGSPPPMRGKGPDKIRSKPVWGITPAYAGKRHRK